MVKDADLEWTFFNKAFCDLAGLPKEELCRRSQADVASPEEVATYERTETEVLETGEDREVEETYTQPDGRQIILKARKRRVFLPTDDGPKPYVVISLVDITELREVERELATVLDSTTDSVMVLDHDWCVTYLNANATETLSGYGVKVGDMLWDAVPGLEDSGFGRNYRRAVETGEPVSFEEYFAETGHWVEVHAFPIAKGLSVFFKDITERRKAEQERLQAQEKISHMARHDLLTDLPNRQQFTEHLQRTLAERRSDDGLIGMHFIDLDGFKAVNDTMGHAAGDLLLQRVADRIRNTVRGSDLVARFGGDEFAVLQCGLKDRDAAGELAGRLVGVLSEPFEIEGQTAMVGASVGVATAPTHGETPEDLIRAADTALYAAKDNGGGAYRFFEADLDALTREKQAMRAALRLAISRNEFELRFQPLIDLRSGALSCFEALLRWRHPERGLVSPSSFIPLAEESGLIIPIGEWALREACVQATRWPEEIALAVNLSPVQFRKPGLVDLIASVLSETGLRPDRLQLEITETVLLQEEAANIATLQELRKLGVHIALDDFGTGYSSLGYLRSFPFDKVKLDGSFVRDLQSRKEARAIVHAMADLGSGLGLTMAAEGIETAEQLAAIQREGYAEGQGFLFSKPVSAEEAPTLILRHAAQAIRRAWDSDGEDSEGLSPDQAARQSGGG